MRDLTGFRIAPYLGNGIRSKAADAAKAKAQPANAWRESSRVPAAEVSPTYGRRVR